MFSAKLDAAKLEVLATMKETLAEIDQRIEAARGVLNGSPWIIELCHGLYLGQRKSESGEDGFGGVGIVGGGLVFYTPGRIDAAVQHVIHSCHDIFPDARKVHHLDALHSERSAVSDLIARLSK